MADKAKQTLAHHRGLVSVWWWIALVLVACNSPRKPAPVAVESEPATAAGPYGLTEQQAQKVLLRVGDRTLRLRQAAELLGPRPRRRGGPSESARRAAFVEEQLNSSLLEVEARRAGIYERPEMVQLHERAAVSTLVSDLTSPTPTVTEAEVRVFFERHPERFTVPARAQAFHILAADRRKAMSVIRRLGSGVDLNAFMGLAMKESLDSYTRDRGGRLPMAADVAVGPEGTVDQVTSPSVVSVPPSITKALFDDPSALGLLPEPVQSERGFHVVFVSARSEKKPVAFEMVKTSLTKELVEKRAQEKVEDVISALLKTQDVQRDFAMLEQLDIGP